MHLYLLVLGKTFAAANSVLPGSLEVTFILLIFTDYTDEKILKLLNSELADTFGNLLSRVTGKALNPSQVFPKCHAELFPWQQSSQLASGRATAEDYALVSAVSLLPGEGFMIPVPQKLKFNKRINVW